MAIREAGKNKYRIEAVIGYNGNQKIRHYETFIGGKKEAELRESELKLQMKNNTYVKKTKLTMKELIEEWLEFKKNNIGIKTYKNYELYTKTIIQYMGHIRLENINAKILEDFYKHLKIKNNLAPKSIKHYYTCITDAFNCAIKWNYVLQNPNNKVDAPKVPKKQAPYYNTKQVNLLVSHLKNEPLKYQALILLALDTAARRGELTGLNWSDIDFEDCSVDIYKSSQYVSGYGIYEKDTKSDTSNRKIYIAATTIAILKKYQKEELERRLKLGNNWKGSKRVFTNIYGGDMHPDTPSRIISTVINNYNKTAEKDKQLHMLNFHGLRHTGISLLIARGKQHQVISRKAGHSSVKITDSIYSHIEDEACFKELADTMDIILQAK